MAKKPTPLWAGNQSKIVMLQSEDYAESTGVDSERFDDSNIRHCNPRTAHCTKNYFELTSFVCKHLI